MTATPRWIHVPRPVSQPLVRLFCFPYAGSSAAAYYPWASLLPPSVELCAIELPGRGERMNEPLARSLETVIEQLLPILRAHLQASNVRFAFFGHSLGALLAFEITRRLQEAGAQLPACLFVSGRPAPQALRISPRLHFMSDDEFDQALRAMDGTDEEVLMNRELMTLMRPILRADLTMSETWRYQPSEKPLTVPVTVMAGEDEFQGRLDELTDWAAVTSADCQVGMFPGGHFFLHSSRDAVIDLLVRELI